MTAHQCVGVILAGGGATRFGGAPKGLQVVEGARIIDRVAAALREATDELLLVANDPGAAAWLPGVRTVADVRHAFAKHGGNLGSEGSVAFLFRHCGQLVFAPGTDENALMEAALEAGADDVITNDDGSIEVITGPYAFAAAKDALAKAGFKPEFAEITMKPSTDVELGGADAPRMQKLIDALESLDDVQDVHTNAVLDE